MLPQPVVRGCEKFRVPASVLKNQFVMERLIAKLGKPFVEMMLTPQVCMYLRRP